MLGLGCVPALALGFGMLRMPQSPRWLVMSGDDFAARATLAKIRVDDPDTIDRELEEIKESLDEKPGRLERAAAAGGQSGAVGRRRAGDPAAGDRDQHGHLLRADDHRIHRRQLLGRLDPRRGRGRHHQRRHDASGAAPARPGRPADAADDRRLGDGRSRCSRSAAPSSAAVAAPSSSVVAIVSLMVYVASFAISLGPIFWLLNAEIYPLAVRSKAAGLGTMANWTFNFIVSLTFLLLIEAVGPQRRLLALRRRSASFTLGSAGSSSPRPRASTSRTSRPTSKRGVDRPSGCRP